MKLKNKITTALAGAAIIALAATGCSSTANAQYNARQSQQKEAAITNSQEVVNLKEKQTRENNKNTIRYLYLMNYGKIVGYYVTKGKISSNGSQIAPEEEVVKSYGGDGYVVDSSQDDGSYGSGDPGIFFFTTDGVMVVTSLDYVQSDSPLAIDVPRLDAK